MELRFDAMLCSNLGNENSDAGRIKSNVHAGRRFPTPDIDTQQVKRFTRNKGYATYVGY